MELLQKQTGCSCPHVELDSWDVFYLYKLLSDLECYNHHDNTCIRFLLDGLLKELHKPQSSWKPNFNRLLLVAKESSKTPAIECSIEVPKADSI